MTTFFEACGKFILTGEHFILYDTPALVLPWQSATFRLTRAKEASTVSEAVMEAWQQARQCVGLPSVARFPFRIVSSIPVGCGFGSSAALCVALLKAAAEEAKHSFDEPTLIQEATALEALFHGRSSGLDPTIAVIQQPLHFTMSASWRPFSWGLEGFGFVLAVTHEERKTAKAVAKVRAFSESTPVVFSRLNAEMKDLVANVEQLIADHSTNLVEERAVQLGRLLSRNHAILSEVGVSSSGLEHLVAVARKAGALGAKLTGAGLGGGMIAFAASSQLPQLAEALKQAGARHCALCVPASRSI